MFRKVVRSKIEWQRLKMLKVGVKRCSFRSLVMSNGKSMKTKESQEQGMLRIKYFKLKSGA